MAVKKKLLFVNDLLQGGGVEKLMNDLVWSMHEQYDISVMTFNYCKGAADIYPPDVRYLCPSPAKEVTGSRIVRKIKKQIVKMQKKIFWRNFNKMHFDVIVALKEGYTLKDTLNLKNADRRYAYVHTDYNNYYYTYDMYGGPDNEREAMRQFDKIICVADDIRKGIIDQLGDPGNLEVLYNPIDVQNILEMAEEPVVDMPPVPTPGVTRFVTVGRLNYQKGFDLLLEACHMLEEDGLKFEVWIIGAEEPWGDEHNRLYRKHRKLGLQNVTFLGGRKNPYKYMCCADWFLSSSIFEGYSLVSQEAAVLDVPLILTDCSGVRELLGDSEYGIVMEISVLDIYKNMKRVIEHPELREHYKQKIMERKQIITYEERLQKIKDLF